MPSQALIFYQPRSACRVMMRMVFDKQPNMDKLLNQFSGARGAQVGWSRSENYENGMSESDLTAFKETVQKDIETWQTQLKQSQDQTYPFAAVLPDRVLEYMQTTQNPGTTLRSENFTMIPDSLLLAPGTLPILVVRNPRLTVPSTFRVLRNMGLNEGGGRPMALMTTSLIWNRVLFDFFTEHNIHPLVLDADDYLTSEDYVKRICDRLDLDPAKAQFSWPALSEEEKSRLHPTEFLSAEELFKSTGPDAQRAGPNMGQDLGQSNWEKEFGLDDTKLIEELVGYGMLHYEYLLEKKLQL